MFLIKLHLCNTLKYLSCIVILQAAISGAVELYWITKKGSYVFCPY